MVTPIGRTCISDKGSDNFFMQFPRWGKIYCSASQSFYSRSQCQVVTLNTLSKYFICQILLFRQLPAIAAPFISDPHADVKRREQCQ